MRLELDATQPLDEVLELVRGARLVSFDLIGTLVESDFISLAHLFRFIEDQTRWSDFALDRELSALIQAALDPDYPGSWTLDDIYRDVRGNPDVERRLLTASLRPGNIGAQLYEAALAAGVPVVVAVDGPLTADEIKAVLNEHGYRDVLAVHASSGTKFSKQKYTTFRNILKAYEVEPNDAVHVGSDPYNDLGVPADIGMHAVLVRPATEALARENRLFAAVMRVIAAEASPQGSLLLRAIERVFLDIRRRGIAGSPELAVLSVMRAAALGGPIVSGFFAWIRSWLAASDSNVCIVAGPLDSPFTRVFRSLMAKREPQIVVVAADLGSIPSDPVRFRDLEARHCAIVSLDFEGRGAGMLVARNPGLAVRPALHLALTSNARRSRHDHCFLSRYGLPLALAADVERLDLEGLLFRESDSTFRSALLGIALFISEWETNESRYTDLRVSRAMAVTLIRGAASAEEGA